MDYWRLCGVMLVVMCLAAPAMADEKTTVATTAKAVTDSRHFSVLTYNVHGLPETMSPLPTTRNAALISPLLSGYDVVLIQEDWFHHDVLTGEAGHSFVSTPMKENPTVIDPGDGLSLLSQFPFEAFERHTWEKCYGRVLNHADCGADKGFTVGWIGLGDDFEIPVINLHMDAGSSEGDEEARRSQVEQLARWVEENVADGPLIAAGDTNLHVGRSESDAAALDRLLELGLVDVCHELDCGFERIDRVFFRSGAGVSLQPLSWQEPGDFVDDDEQHLSDHYPIAVDFSWAVQQKLTDATSAD